MDNAGRGQNPGEKRKWIIDFEAKNARQTKIAISVLAAILSIILLLICVYVIIPAVINDASDSMDHSFAKRMYESTLVSPRPKITAQPAFMQPDVEAQASKPRECFAVALSQNSDTAGRIMIENIGIAYLVMQCNDNERYLKTGYSGDDSRGGSVFLDYRCDAATRPLKGHYILYGHNMKNGTMFHSLMEYKDEKTFYANRIIRFDTLYDDHSWEIFSAYVTDTDFYYIDTDFANDEEWLTFLRAVKNKSMFETNTALTADDVLLTLSTCTYEFDGARFVIHARLLE